MDGGYAYNHTRAPQGDLFSTATEGIAQLSLKVTLGPGPSQDPYQHTFPGSGSTDKGKGREGEQETPRPLRSGIYDLLNDQPAKTSGDKGKSKEKREKSKSDSPKGDDGKDRKGKRPRRD